MPQAVLQGGSSSRMRQVGCSRSRPRSAGAGAAYHAAPVSCKPAAANVSNNISLISMSSNSNKHTGLPETGGARRQTGRVVHPCYRMVLWWCRADC